MGLVIRYALAARFALDWQGFMVDWKCPEEWEDMESQKTTICL